VSLVRQLGANSLLEQAEGMKPKVVNRNVTPKAAKDRSSPDLATNVGFWPIADMTVRNSDVRFRAQSGHPVRLAGCLQMTQSGHAFTKLRLVTL
jgi:hypothetical protein